MRCTRVVLAALFAATFTTAARANFVAVFASNSTNTFNYSLRYTVDQTGETLRNGDYVTIYDVSPSVSLTSATAPANFTVSFNDTGITPVGIGAPFLPDNPAFLNVTFTYKGATLNGAVGSVFDFPGAQILTSGNYTALQAGKALGTTSFTALGDQASINVTQVPAASGGIPEPASLALLGIGGLAILTRRR